MFFSTESQVMGIVTRHSGNAKLSIHDFPFTIYYSHMRYRQFGRTGWQVSEVGYGMWGMAGWSGSDDEESLRALDRAFALGCNFFDTAWAYGAGKSEQLLGQALKKRGPHTDPVVRVATKIPPKNMRWPGKAEYPIADI